MSSTREIKQRIANVSSVKQIVHAMDMVSSTKLVRARRDVEDLRPLYDNLKRIIRDLSQHEANEDNLYFNNRQVKKSLYIIMTADQGLSGSYNQKMVKHAVKHMEENNKNEQILISGVIGRRLLEKLNKNIIRSIYDVSDDDEYYGSKAIAEYVHDLYVAGDIDEVFVAYTHFENVLKLEPRVKKILPIDLESDEGYFSDVSYEPDMETYVNRVMPFFLHMSIFHAYTEAHASEQASRSIAMDAAGTNADDLLEELQSEYNRVRQYAITEELNEIVSSAQSMKEGGTN